MRVISGKLGRREFLSPASKLTHPMSEKMRAAIFSALGDITGLSVLDVYSGSGSLAIEAVSRGAGAVTAVESDVKAVQVIRENVRRLEIEDNLKVIQSKVGSWNTTNRDKFDVILADPPYHGAALSELNDAASRVVPGGLLVLSWPGKEKLPVIASLTLISERHYGDASLGYYRAG